MSKVFVYADYIHTGVMAAHWAPDEVREMVCARVNGKTMPSIAKWHGCSYQTVSRILKRLKPYNGEEYDWCFVLPEGNEE